MALLTAYPWPGNVRQLQNTLERAAIMTDAGEITPDDLDLPRTQADNGSNGHASGTSLEETERQAILNAVKKTGWVQSRAGELLGISRRAMNYKIQKYGIQHSSWKINAPTS